MKLQINFVLFLHDWLCLQNLYSHEHTLNGRWDFWTEDLCPLKTPMLKPSPHCDGVWRRALWDKVGVLMKAISALKRTNKRELAFSLPVFSYVRAQGKGLSIH